jgi:hypothetical protein
MSRFRSLVVLSLVAVLVIGLAASSVLAQGEEPPTITITGRVTYGRDDLPAAGVKISVMDWDFAEFGGFPGEDVELAVAVTDADGYFTATGINNQDEEGQPRRDRNTGQDVFIDVYTESPEIVLLDAARQRPFKWRSKDTPGGFWEDIPDGASRTINFHIEPRADVQAMEVYQTMRSGWNLLSPAPTLAEPILAQWGPNSAVGTYFDPGDRIYYDASVATYPHVILHHFAHSLMWHLMGAAGYPVSCFPTVEDHSFDLRGSRSVECAWAEGFAVGFAAIVLDNPGYRTGDGVIDLETPDADTPGWADGDTVAGRVAGALWDLYDATDDGFDEHTPLGATAAEQFAPIWEAIMAGRPTTMSAFWDAYLDGDNDLCTAVAALFQNTIDYNQAPTVADLPPVNLPEDTTLDNAIDLWEYAEDFECPDEALIFTLIGDIPPEFGVSIDSNRWIDVNPAPNWFGQIEIGIEVSDGLESTRRFFLLTIGAVNDPPILSDIPEFEALINTQIVVDLAPYVEDVDDLDTALTVSVEGLEHATVEIDGLQLTFTPEQDFEDTITPLVRVEDPQGGSDQRELILTWSRFPNEPPEIVGLPDAFPAQSPGVAISIDFTQYGRDLEDDPEDLTWVVKTITTEPEADRVIAQPASGSDRNRVWIFTPTPGFKGSAVVSVVVADTDGGRSAPAQTLLSWEARENQPPGLLRPIPDQTTYIGRPLVLDLRGYATDPDGNDAALRWFANRLTVDCCQVSLAGRQRLIFYPLPSWGSQPSTTRVELVVRDPEGAELRTWVNLTWDYWRMYMPFIGLNFNSP